jgi:hypothetical protein
MAGKTVIVNAVLSALPIYFMSAFILPKWVIHEIDTIRRNFLWKGLDTDSRKIHLANWSLICRSKSKGGLGIINIEIMNIALIAKWYWKWFHAESSIWRQLNCILGVNLREWDMANPIPF